MKNRIGHALLLAFAISFNFLSAQQGDWCGTDQRIQRLINSSPQYAQQWQDYLSSMQNASSEAARSANDIVYVPLVFHIVYDTDQVGSGENINEDQVLSQIDALNNYYNSLDPDIPNVPAPFQSLVGNCNVQFCLAKFDPNGNPTTGIIRHSYPTIPAWNTENDIDNTLKPATIWDPSSYLNVWSVRMGGDLITQGVLAYSSLPGLGPANQDGVVARYSNIGTTSEVPASYRKGKTLTHEMGHWFGLLHIWGLTDSCGDQGDFINDTPDQAGPNYNCPQFPHVSCSSATGDMFMNYMDYTNDNCSNMFTIDQAARMHQTLDGTRASIKNAASGCYYNLDGELLQIALPSDTVCSLTFKPVVTLKNEGTTAISSGNIYFQIDGGTSQIVTWSGSLTMQQQTQLTLPQQTVAAGIHTIEVTFSNVNGQASDNYSGNDSKTLSFYAYDAGAGGAIPFSENFETLFPETNWSISNPNNDITWEQSNNAGGYGLSFSSASINNLGYTSNPGRKKDGLITDAYDLTAIAYPELKFDVAYARYNANRTDSLNIYYSFDCGKTWTKIWNQSGAELATAPDQTTAFVPTASQWKTVSVSLLSIGNQNKVTFKFENVAGWGNKLYLDNVNLDSNPAEGISEVAKEDVQVFPNPAGTIAAVRLPANHSFKRMELINNLGEVVYETNIADNSVIFSVAGYADGLYFIHLTGNASTQTQKLLISK